MHGMTSQLSRVGLGTNNFGRRIDLDATRAVIDAALEVGVTHFDTADIYGDGDSERFIGEILKNRRDQVFLATKFGMADGGDGSPGYVQSAIEASLERLQTDHVDLYYYHRPDGKTPIAETIGAMHELVEAGKVGSLGVSNVDAAQLREAAGTAPVLAVQNEYSLLARGAGADILPVARELEVGFVPYFPLAHGLLTGKYRRGEAAPEGTRLHDRPEMLTDERFDQIEALEGFASKHGHSLLELAIAALASEPGVLSVIAGATKPEQVRANAAASDWRLNAADLGVLNELFAE
jgi:aryl-alcohol dehydrogenase-like predicted oxidoreductase